MSGLLMHAVVFVAVNGLLTAAWILLGPGTADEAWQSFTDLDDAQQYGFWPIYVMIAWAAALLVHAGATVSLGLRKLRRRSRKRRTDRRRSAAAARSVETTAPAAAASNPGGVDRRWFAVMFTDVVSSTELARSLGDDGYAAALRAHRAEVRSCLEAHNGTEVGTQGDGFLLRFDSPDAAVACAVALQDGLTTSQDDLPVRIGIHAGEVVHDGEDDDLMGRVVNLASRVTDVAGTGEILVTEAVADHMTLDYPLTDRGLRELKGFDRPRHLLSVVWRPEVDHLDLDAATDSSVAHPDGH